MSRIGYEITLGEYFNIHGAASNLWMTSWHVLLRKSTDELQGMTLQLYRDTKIGLRLSMKTMKTTKIYNFVRDKEIGTENES